MTRSIQESTFAIVANGQPDSPPAGPFREFLVSRGARRVTTIIHPLTLEDGAHHEITVFEGGRQIGNRRVRLPSRPPYTYPLDFFVPPWPDPVDGWFAFNNLACMRGLLARRLGRATTVTYWAVDFVPDRFEGGPMTRVYDMLDRRCCLHADARFDVSHVALDGRARHHGLSADDAAPSAVVPIGAWVGRVPVVPEDGWRARRVVYLGHLVERQGVGTLIDALRLLSERGIEFDAEIGGRGPLEGDLRDQVSRSGLDGKVRFRGFIPDHKDVEAFLADGSVAIAPYDTRIDSFTRFADPGKLKSYAAAGLPIVTTDVPPNAHELSQRAGAEIVGFDSEAIAGAIERALDSPDDWLRRRAAALEYARDFDWERIFTRALEVVDFRP
jgi:glycosyltransferase involved in cell wall biosynthesis